MKSKTLLSALCAIFSVTAFAGKDPVLMTVESDSIYLSDFRNIYAKNNSLEEGVDASSLDEYLTLFVNFKLKVKAAMDLGMDTTAAFKNELAGYRKQLAQPYLIDQNVNEALIEEAYNRLKEEVSASHILIKVGPNASPVDTLKAWNQIQQIRKKATSGEDFEKIAKAESQDPSAAQNGGALGYFTAFQMVYEFESAAFNTEVGEISDVVRTRFGYHILKVNDRRPARGEIRVAHILVKTMSSYSDEQMAEAKSKVDEIYAKLQAGEDFVELAKAFSDDKTSGRKGGTLPWFGIGKMIRSFEDASFSLTENGQISEPFQTKLGWHIVKRIDKKELPPFEEMKSELKSKVSRDSRGGKSRESLLQTIKTDYGYKLNKAALNPFYKWVDVSFFKGKWKRPEGNKYDQVLFTLDDQKYSGQSKSFTQSDFAEFVEKASRHQPEQPIKALVDQLFDQFVEQSCINFEDGLLDKKYPEFRALMQEYRDGILLFELMDQKVWTKAVEDTAGLSAYYMNHKTDSVFMWGQRAKANVFTCANEDVAKQLRKLIAKRDKKGLSNTEIVKQLNETSALNVQYETGMFQKNDNLTLDKAKWVVGISEPFKDGDRIAVVEISEVIAPTPKTLKECKGQATAAYQTYLEEQWIAELREKYKVNVDRQVLTQLAQ